MSDRLVFCGSTVMVACACGAATSTSSVLSTAGASVPTEVTYPVLVGSGALLFALGIRNRPRVWLPAALAFLAFGTAIALAPQQIMHGGHTLRGAEFLGIGGYFVTVALFIWTALRLYRPVEPGPAIAALAGIGLAAGCTCCLVPGSTRLLGLWAGLDPTSWLISRPLLLTAALMVASTSLVRSVGMKAFVPLLTGAFLVYPLESFVEHLVPSLHLGQANIVFVLRYPIWLAGNALLVYGATRPLFAQSTEKAEEPAVGTLPATATA